MCYRSDVDAAHEYFALGGLVKTTDKLNECRFARAVIADHRQTLPAFYPDAYVFKDISVGVRVFEGDVYKLDIVSSVCRVVSRNGRGAVLLPLGYPQKFLIVIDIFREELQLGKAPYKVAERACERRHRTEKYRKRTDGDAARDRKIRAVAVDDSRLNKTDKQRKKVIAETPVLICREILYVFRGLPVVFFKQPARRAVYAQLLPASYPEHHVIDIRIAPRKTGEQWLIFVADLIEPPRDQCVQTDHRQNYQDNERMQRRDYIGIPRELYGV